MIEFVYGFACGAICLVCSILFFLYLQFGEQTKAPNVSEQTDSFTIPSEIRSFLNLDEETIKTSEKESCFSLSLILHFLFQEHKDTRLFRRWLHKRLQLELNDISSRNAAAHYVVHHVRVRDLSVGSQFPIIKNIAVENMKICETDNSIESLSLLIDLTYTGDFHTSIFASTFLGETYIGVKIAKLTGTARIIMSRHPYPHWAFCFTTTPNLELEFETQFGGIAAHYFTQLIDKQFRSMLQKKQVWPNYKIRYRPFFPNPLMQPTPSPRTFQHVEIEGGLQVTVIQGTRLPVQIVDKNATVYVAVFLDPRPFANYTANNNHCTTLMINFPRNDAKEELGLTFAKCSDDFGSKKIKIESVVLDSSAAAAGFKHSDIILSVNNVIIHNENQVVKLLTYTKGDLAVLVERENEDLFRSDTPDSMEDLIDEELVNVEFDTKRDKNGQLVMTTIVDSHGVREETLEKIKGQITDDLKNETSPSHVNVTENNETEEKASLSVGKSYQKTPSTSPTIEIHPSPFKRAGTTVRPMSYLEGKMEKGGDKKWNSCDNLVVNYPEESVGSCENGEDKRSMHSQQHEQDTSSDAIDNISEDNDSLTSSKMSKKTRIAVKCQQVVSKFSTGKSKLNEMLKGRKDRPNSVYDSERASDNIDELCEEATEENIFNCDTDSLVNPTTLMNDHNDKKRPNSLEVPVVDASSKNKTKNGVKAKKLKKTSTVSTPHSKDDLSQNESLNKSKIFAKNTSDVPLQEKVKWNENLHFSLEKNVTKYLNVLVYAKMDASAEPSIEKEALDKNEKCGADKDKAEKDNGDNTPILLGYTSVYIPQIIDDCNLTMSKCHKEVFDLRPTRSSNLQFTNNFNISNKPGFDRRLCFGDIKIGFKYYEKGIPEEVSKKVTDTQSLKSSKSAEKSSKASLKEEEFKKVKVSQDNSVNQPSKPKYPHNWSSIVGKSTHGLLCEVCKTKHWFAGLNKCVTCNMLAHSKKCVDKAVMEYECNPENVRNAITEMEQNLLSKSASKASIIEYTNEQIPISSKETDLKDPDHKDSPKGLRRRKFAQKVSEGIKFIGKAYAESKNSKKAMESNEQLVNMIHLEEIISEELAVLECPKGVREMNIEPHNSYNEQVINSIREQAKVCFHEITDLTERKDKCEEKVNIVQKYINDVVLKKSEIRLETKSSEEGLPSDIVPDPEEALKLQKQIDDYDLKLQALALVMIYYCTGQKYCTNSHEDDF
uniref:PDZ domain-containing protein 8 n=1 Tax=Rhabditophanes sp. KR3021 TaxID=114890 RepID=A0AC35U7G3_9BILA